MNEDEFEVAIIDADSILYQIAHYQPSPALCRKAFDDKLAEIMTNTSALSGAVFIKGKDNFRYAVAADYKGNRKDTLEPEVKDRLEKLYKYAAEFCIESDNAEADDYCGVAFKLAQQENKSAIVCHIDKDLDALSGWHYNFRKQEFYHIDEAKGYWFLMKQILMGDSTDNIQGIKGLGPKTAEKILADIPSNLLLQTVIDTYKAKTGNSWQNEFAKAANLIYIRESGNDFRQLTYEELTEKLSWKQTMDTGLPSQSDPKTLSDSSTQSLDQLADNTSEESN